MFQFNKMGNESDKTTVTSGVIPIGAKIIVYCKVLYNTKSYNFLVTYSHNSGVIL